jgi:sugar phosphate isomerase/epimerase
MGIPIFSPGQWPNSGDGVAANIMAQREISMLAQLGHAARMQIALHNATPNFVGSSLPAFDAMVRPFDSVVGFNFDVGFAAAYGAPAGADAAAVNTALLVSLRQALPRLKMCTARDCAWTKADDGSVTLKERPLGEGMVDWDKLFAALAQAHFAGPITLQTGYAPKDTLAAVRKDLAFLKQRRAAAYS